MTPNAYFSLLEQTKQHSFLACLCFCVHVLFSCIFTLNSLLQQGAFYSSLVFMSQFPRFAWDCIILSICSGLGQLLIYHTISAFGPLVFTIIMTLRQAMAIILSCALYGHPITASGVFGTSALIMVVFDVDGAV